MSTTTYNDLARTSVANTFTASQTFSGRAMTDRGADVASANDITLGSDGENFTITGTTNVQRIATASWNDGAIIALRFSSAACTISHNTAAGGGFASILLVGAANYNTSADDVLWFQYDSTTVAFRQILPNKLRPSDIEMKGRFKELKGANLTAASTLALGFDGNKFIVTGNTNIDLITSTGWQDGAEVDLIFTGTPTINHGTATSGANYTILLQDGVNFGITKNPTIVTFIIDVTNTRWLEKSRKALAA